jgi:peptidoglycan/xylan/chitin deacetylase (PgdA/CDA1 family)
MPLIADRSIVPVLMFHSVGLRSHAWAWRHLSEPLEAFVAFLDWLHGQGFHTIGLPELQAHMRGEQRAPDNAVVLTFDDGYLDNWVYAAPLLRQRGMRGTVFVSPDFVDPGEGLRQTLDDTWSGRLAASDLSPAGFMNWDELRRLDRERVLDVQSHAMTHTWWFTEPKIIGWHRGEALSPWPWLAWNARPERKPWYLVEDQAGFVPAGHPVFSHRQALVARRFDPDPDAVATLTQHVAAHGGQRYFETPAWRQALDTLVSHIAPDGVFPGRYESETEQKLRVRTEIVESRKRIASAVAKRVDYICWPAGGSDDFCEREAEAAGYLGWTLRSTQQRAKRNRPGEDPRSIRRLSGQRGIFVSGRRIGEGSVRLQALQLQAHRNSLLHAALLRGYKLTATLGITGQGSIH